MLQDLLYLRKVSVFSKLFNLRNTELKSVTYLWSVAGIFRVGFVIGWTVLLALFVTDYGIEYVPFFFLIHAVFLILGSIIFSLLKIRIPKKTLMYFSLLGAAFLLSISFFLYGVHREYFYALLIIAEVFFLMQFRIIFMSYIEECYSPLESQRTFPVIESSETIGGIVGGLILSYFSGYVELNYLILIWIAFIFLILPLLFFAENFCLPHTSESSFHCKRNCTIFSNFFDFLKKTDFLKILAGIVFCQWLIFNLLEFIYTKSVYGSVVIDAGGAIEHALIHDLGFLFLIFSFSALIFQLFLGSRIIQSLGIFGAMILHPIIILFSLSGLFFSFGFFTSALAKNNFSITNVLFNNTYHSSYYAIKEEFREISREFLEGVIRPFGALIGTFILIFWQYYFPEKLNLFLVNLALLLVVGLMFYLILRNQKKYTNEATNRLNSDSAPIEQLEAVDILAQRGHVIPYHKLSKIVLSITSPFFLRLKIIKSLACINEKEASYLLLNFLGLPNSFLFEATLDSLFLLTKKSFFLKNTDIFLNNLIIENLRKCYLKETEAFKRHKIIDIISAVKDSNSLAFLISQLKNKKDEFYILKSLRNFACDDLREILVKKIKNPNGSEKMAIAMALYPLSSFRPNTFSLIEDYLGSNSVSQKILALIAIGELKLFHYKEKCLDFLNSRNRQLKIHGALALGKMGFDDGLNLILKILLTGPSFAHWEKIYEIIFQQINYLEVRVLKNIVTILINAINQGNISRKKEISKIILNCSRELISNKLLLSIS